VYSSPWFSNVSDENRHIASMQDEEDDEGEDDLEAEGDDDLEADAEGDEDEELDDEEPQDDDEDMVRILFLATWHALLTPGPEQDTRKDDGAVSDASNSPLPKLKQPRLKIKLKLPALPASSASVTPVPEEIRKAGSRGKRRRPAPGYSFSSFLLPSGSFVLIGLFATLDYAEDDDDDFDDEMMPSSTATSSKGRLTSRQAVLANVVDATHVTLGILFLSEDLFWIFRLFFFPLESAGTTPKGKKKQLNETEIALKREETARKRRNLTEKKLEDEKVGRNITGTEFIDPFFSWKLLIDY
jgi:Ino eighty subunit 2